jgi:ABC-type molybdate transport system substrate-binding protein
MMLRRRHLFGLAASVPFAWARPARAGAWAEDSGIHTEPSLQPALRQAAGAFTSDTGLGVAVLAAPAALLLAQIQRNAAEDILVLPARFMDEAEKRNYVVPSTRRDAWRNPLVLAVSANLTVSGADAGTILARGPVAVTDATDACSLDGHAVLDQLGLSAKAPKLIGTANTLDAAYLVTTGEAASALVFATDLRATPSLALGVSLPPSTAQIVSFALNRDPPGKHARALWDFLQTREAASRLQAAGLEKTT